MADNDNINRGITNADLIRAISGNQSVNPQLNIPKPLLSSPLRLNVIPHVPRPIANSNEPMRFGGGGQTGDVLKPEDAQALWAINRMMGQQMPDYQPGTYGGRHPPRESTNVEDRTNQAPYLTTIDEILAAIKGGQRRFDNSSLPTFDQLNTNGR